MNSLEDILTSSRAALVWTEATQALASELIATIHTRDEVLASFDALHGALTRTLLKVGSAWNDSHDRFRVLPPELQEQCLAESTLSSKCRLALVSTHWRESIAALPAIWTDISLSRVINRSVNLDAILARSGKLGFALQLAIRDDLTLSYVDNCLRRHAHRLRRLDLELEDTDSASSPIFRYQAPVLEALTLTYNGWEETWEVDTPARIFEGYAPKLRFIHLDQISVPAVCPAFANVTSAAIRYCTAGSSNVYSVLPSLQTLEIQIRQGPVPEVPATSSLRVLRLSKYRLTGKELRESEAGRLVSFTAEVTYDLQQLTDALSQEGHGAPSLEITTGQSLELDFQRDGRSRRFVFYTAKLAEVQRVLHTSTVFHGIRRLVVPCPAVFGEDGAMHLLPAYLPRLHTLGMHQGGGVPHMTAASIGPLRGPLRAPALTRIELLANERDAEIYTLPPIDAAHLAAFIEDALEGVDRGNLEIFAETTRGVRLVGDMDRLQACVGRILGV